MLSGCTRLTRTMVSKKVRARRRARGSCNLGDDEAEIKQNEPLRLVCLTYFRQRKRPAKAGRSRAKRGKLQLILYRKALIPFPGFTVTLNRALPPDATGAAVVKSLVVTTLPSRSRNSTWIVTGRSGPLWLVTVPATAAFSSVMLKSDS